MSDHMSKETNTHGRKLLLSADPCHDNVFAHKSCRLLQRGLSDHLCGGSFYLYDLLRRCIHFVPSDHSLHTMRSPFIASLAVCSVIIAIALSMPYHPDHQPSMIGLPSSSVLLPASTLNLTNFREQPGWPQTPWTYRDGPQIVRFEEYGRLANSTSTKDVIRATLDIELMISKGAAFIRDGSHSYRHGGVIFKIMISGREFITMEEAFRILDYWRVYSGAFGAKEILLGEIGNAKPWVPAAAFNIVFDIPMQHPEIDRSSYREAFGQNSDRISAARSTRGISATNRFNASLPRHARL